MRYTEAVNTVVLGLNQQFTEQAELAVRQYCKTVHEITYIEHGADNLVILANREHVFRFPRNEAAMHRLYFEAALLQKLQDRIQAVTIPRIEHISHQPLFTVSTYVEGLHLSNSQVQALTPEEQAAIGTTVGTFVAQLNQATAGEEVQRLRTEARLDGLEEPWAPYFERLFAGQQLPTPKLAPAVQQFYPLWREYVQHEQATMAIHDDLHAVNLLFVGPTLHGILDFGDANVGSVESELRWVFGMGPTVLDAAIQAYQDQAGQSINRDHIRVWAIMHALSTFTSRLQQNDVESIPFLRARADLHAWLPDFAL